MSRIGKQPVEIPSSVTVEVKDGVVVVRGQAGTLEVPVPNVLEVKIEGSQATVVPKRETKQTAALWGLTRSLLANAMEGLSKGYTKKLEIHGVGYRVNLQGDTLVMALGYSHDVTLKAPVGITFGVEKNEITVSGYNKELVGNVAAKIRAFRKPEPYKGKGIRYSGEIVRRKAGKKAASA